MKKFNEITEKVNEIMGIVLACSIPLAYIASIIYTEIRVPEYESGLPLVIGFAILPISAVVTAVVCASCVKSLTNIGAYVSSKRYEPYYWSPCMGIIMFILELPFALVLLCGTVTMFTSVTGIYNFGMFTY